MVPRRSGLVERGLACDVMVWPRYLDRAFSRHCSIEMGDKGATNHSYSTMVTMTFSEGDTAGPSKEAREGMHNEHVEHAQHITEP
jgi:hypothetical protein